MSLWRPGGCSRLTLASLAVLTVLAALTGGCGAGAESRRPVTLQLNWYHEAEFVGYYAALAKGFYAEEGLDVTILAGGPPQPPAREAVLNGAAQFAVTSFAEQKDLVTQGQPTVAVFSAFQIQPLVIFSLVESDIVVPADLLGKTVGTTTDYWKRILRETLSAAGVDPSLVTTVEVKPDELGKLYDRTVDAWLGYTQDEPIQAQVAGHPVRRIFPADFGIGGYEGLLITRQATIDDDPELVARFVRASHRDWHYALEHPAEAAQILVDWAGNSLEFQKLAVSAVVPLVDTPQVPVGWIAGGRWEQLMGETYRSERPGFTMMFSPEKP